MRPVGGSSPMPLTRRPHTPRRRPSSFRISVFGFPSDFGLRVSDFDPKAPLPRDAVASLVSAGIRFGRLRVQHGAGRRAASGGGAAGAAHPALLRLDRARSFVRLLSTVCAGRADDAVASAGAVAWCLTRQTGPTAWPFRRATIGTH